MFVPRNGCRCNVCDVLALADKLRKMEHWYSSKQVGLFEGKPRKHWLLAQPGSAPALGAGGRRFKSYRPDQCFQADRLHFCFFRRRNCGRVFHAFQFAGLFRIAFSKVCVEIQPI